MAGTSGFLICNQLNNIFVAVLIVLTIAQRLTLAHSAAMPWHHVGVLPPTHKNNNNNQLFWNELLESSTDTGVEQEQVRKYPHTHAREPNYLGKWPGLRDLMMTADYNDDSLESNALVNTRLIERLRQMGDTVGAGDLIVDDVVDVDEREAAGGVVGGGGYNNVLTAMPAKKFASAYGAGSKITASVKDHGTKKNVQYGMYPCHFKICNMGRKRNAGTNTQY